MTGDDEGFPLITSQDCHRRKGSSKRKHDYGPGQDQARALSRALFAQMTEEVRRQAQRGEEDDR